MSFPEQHIDILPNFGALDLAHRKAASFLHFSHCSLAQELLRLQNCYQTSQIFQGLGFCAYFLHVSPLP